MAKATMFDGHPANLTGEQLDMWETVQATQAPTKRIRRERKS